MIYKFLNILIIVLSSFLGNNLINLLLNEISIFLNFSLILTPLNKLKNNVSNNTSLFSSIALYKNRMVFKSCFEFGFTAKRKHININKFIN